MKEFLSEDDLLTFDGWLEFKGRSRAIAKPEELAIEKSAFNKMLAKRNAKVGRMRLGPPKRGEHLYAVAVREGGDLWLTLWVRRSPKGELFVMSPRANIAGWDPHASYHRDGKYHFKSGGVAVCRAERQPLSGAFKGAETLGAFGGHFPTTVGAICNPKDFTSVVEVPTGILGPIDGVVVVDLVEPGCEAPIGYPYKSLVQTVTFKDAEPWVVISVASTFPASRQLRQNLLRSS